jgi:hypothetical protein
MEPEGSLPYSQVLATCSYLESDQSSQCLPIRLTEDPFQDYSPIDAWFFQVASFPQVSPPKSCMQLSCLLYVLHAPPI